jgi:phosphoglycolate phosphatase
MVQTLVFDLDGTLSDPLEGIARSYNHALTAHGFEKRSDAELARLVGPPLDQGLWRWMFQAIGSLLLSRRIASVTGSSATPKTGSDFAARILAMFGLRELFSFVSGGDIGITKAQQLRALVDAGTIDRRALMIGDRAVDVQAAKTNGLASCGALANA